MTCYDFQQISSSIEDKSFAISCLIIMANCCMCCGGKGTAGEEGTRDSVERGRERKRGRGSGLRVSNKDGDRNHRDKETKEKKEKKKKERWMKEKIIQRNGRIEPRKRLEEKLILEDVKMEDLEMEEEIKKEKDKISENEEDNIVKNQPSVKVQDSGRGGRVQGGDPQLWSPLEQPEKEQSLVIICEDKTKPNKQNDSSININKSL
ncbi:DEAD-box ATP-dependent RNA helicase 45-like [Polyodon spathula]|uniref:DEAD-box ATP-dependent RNA helicase 45-like n=1 Tax=Polyodon spathula TaxID=7913 RepID=UPI001B7ECAE9|nr:DEAD-box ATP-dependent RNA helicase 45-like [Polyodon spathula]